MRALPLFALLSGLGLFSAHAGAETVSYTIDPMHTQIRFSWNHFGFSSPGATFSDVQGEIMADEERAERSSVNVSFRVDSIETGVPLLNEHLLTQPEDYFDVKKHPEITFRSTGLRNVDREDREFDLVGTLTVNGISREVVLDAEVNKFGPHPMWDGAKAIGVSAETTLRRSDFGLDKYAPAVSDKLEVEIELEAIETQAYRRKMQEMQQQQQQ